jgi:hypothetical protein
MATYQHPYDSELYPTKPSDTDCIVLARALTHFVTAYCPGEEDRTAESIILDILDANVASDPAMDRDEAVRIARVFGLDF